MALDDGQEIMRLGWGVGHFIHMYNMIEIVRWPGDQT